MDGFLDRSRFMDREILDPARVMEGSSTSSTYMGQVGEHTEGGLMEALKKGEVDLGTSIMAVRYDGGVVIGADSRTSTGVYISNRVSDKVTAVDERIYVCRSGSAADTQAISDYVTYFLDQHKMELGNAPKVSTAANLFRELCYHNKNNLMAGIIVAGWDPIKGGQVYECPLGGAQVEQDFAIGGSGSTYIYGFCDAYYKPGMNSVQCEEFVRKALSHAMARDGSSGGVIRTVKIDESGAERKFVPGNKLPFGPL
uniref:Proteasome subunit beta n=1 Tax=Haptolina brevifila TaxID=156173 RepID=A0A7S2MG03_9EUKA|mmetsp:Transcript_51529/g.102547  ORF Transcript_51529/g.102547 Transcript_51529/m.102547 type:complete len:255 (+) Transcript_51529:95-859(+)